MKEERREPETDHWTALVELFREGVAETEGELPPLGLATAVVARWREGRTDWELGALEWASIRLAAVTSAFALVLWGGWIWHSGPALGDEWLDLLPVEEVAW
jgi:hypothetical protein